MEGKEYLLRLERHMQNNRWISTALLVSFCFFIFILSAVPGNHYPQVSWAFADKLVHMGLYFWLGILAWMFFVQRGSGIPSSFAFGVLYGLSDEFHQVWVPRRTASFADVIADATGVALGLTAIYVIGFVRSYRPQFQKATQRESAQRMEVS